MVDGTLNFEIGIATQKTVEKANKKYGTDYKSTTEQTEEMFAKIYDEMSSIGKKNGMYTGDSFRLKVEIEYMPEDK